MRRKDVVVGIIAVFVWTAMVRAEATDLLVSAEEQVELKETAVFNQVKIFEAGEVKVGRGEPGDAVRSYLELVAPWVEIEKGGRIWSEHGVGETKVPSASGYHGGIGASHGGRGGAPTSDQQQEPYGDTYKPTVRKGCYGGDGPGSWRVGGTAGAAVMIRGTTVIINGEINCDGAKGQDFTTNPIYGPEPEIYFGAGGGSGGGILIIAKHLTIGPNAKITANGGDGGDGLGSMSCREGFPGGGGRVKIFYEDGTISEQAVIEAKAGKRPDEREDCGGNGGAEDGTVYIEKVKTVDALLNPGDLNNDGKTDYKDLLIVQQNWGKEVTPIPTAEPTETPTPEPTATPTPQPTAIPTLP